MSVNIEDKKLTGKIKRRKKRKTKTSYSPGELNRLIDAVVHPLSQTDKRFFLLDGFLHGLVERDPPQTVRKFVRYNLVEILKQLGEKR